MRVKLPKSVVVITGDEEKVQPKIKEFFKSAIVRAKKKLRRPALPGELEIKYFTLAIPNPVPQPVQPTDSAIQILFLRDDPICAVLETRTDFNNVCYTFFKC